MNYKENCLKSQTLQSAHDNCRTFEAAEQQKLNAHREFSLWGGQTDMAGQLLGGVNSAVTSTHLISQINVLHLEKSA